MKIVAKFIERLFTSDNRSHVVLVVDNYYHQYLLQELATDTDYVIEIKKAKSKRSLQQNKYFWKLLQELERVSKQDMMIWYVHILEETNCKFEYLMGLNEIESHLKSVFRAVKKVAPRTIDGKEVMVYKCFYGSSKYSVKEMQELMEVALKYCAEYNIDMELMKYD